MMMCRHSPPSCRAGSMMLEIIAAIGLMGSALGLVVLIHRDRGMVHRLDAIAAAQDQGLNLLDAARAGTLRDLPVGWSATTAALSTGWQAITVNGPHQVRLTTIVPVTP